MNKISLVGMSAIVAAFASGCSNGITILKPVDVSSKIGIVQFADCDQLKAPTTNCEGSGKKVSDVYGKVFGAPVVSTSDASKFDVLITGKVVQYNEAAPMGFQSNVSQVDLTLVDRNNTVLASQVKLAAAGNVFGSAVGCSQTLAEALKSELGR